MKNDAAPPVHPRRRGRPMTAPAMRAQPVTTTDLQHHERAPAPAQERQPWRGRLCPPPARRIFHPAMGNPRAARGQLGEDAPMAGRSERALFHSRANSSDSCAIAVESLRSE